MEGKSKEEPFLPSETAKLARESSFGCSVIAGTMAYDVPLTFE